MMIRGGMDKATESTFEIVLIYASLAMLWIYFSDSILSMLISDPKLMIRADIFKGIVFVLITSGLLFFLVRHYLNKFKKAEEEIRQGEEIFNQFLEYSPMYVFFKDKNIRSLVVSRNFEIMLHRPLHELIGKTMYDLFPASLAQSMVDDDIRILHEGLPIEVEEKFEGRIYSTIKFPIFKDGKPSMLAGFMVDITERNMMEAALRKSEEYNRGLFASSPIPLVLIDPETWRFVDFNLAAEVLFDSYGYSIKREDMLAMTPLTVSPEKQDDGSDSESFARMHINRCIEQGYDYFEWNHKKVNGELRHTEVHLARARVAGEQYIQFSVQDITERKLLEKRMQYVSYHDVVTGLFNRAYFDLKISEFDQEGYLPLSFIMADVNGLKLINDSLGHEAGDRLLKVVAERFKKALTETDIVCRWGGDEFFAILPNVDSEIIESISSRIRGIKGTNELMESGIPVSLSVGVATRDTMDIPIRDLLKQAEDRMYQSKLLESSSIRNSVIVSLQETLAEKNIETEEHSLRIQRYARRIGEELGLPGNTQDELMLLSALHDIGKIAVSETILLKPDKLNEEESGYIKQHPGIGYRIAQSTPELSRVADAILAHHERWDGKGYPNGISGEAIPLISRILAIIDTFDVMVNGRPYREPVSVEEVLAEIKRCAGTQFDPELVELFIKIVKDSDILN